MADDSLDKLYPLIFDSIAEGVFTIDQDFRITSFNREAERITGITRDKAMGRPCHEVLRTNICKGRCTLRHTLETGEQLRGVHVDIRSARGATVPVSVSTAILEDRDGNLVGGVEIFRDRSELETLRNELDGRHGFGEIIGASPAMQDVFRLIIDVAASDATVLLEGPSGTGKELVARAIHEQSGRRDGPFVRVNCSALPDTLLESELFGYIAGAFTDARRDKPGRFTRAHHGTILLDEIGDVSPSFQVKLLRVLQDREIVPLGGTEVQQVDVRVIAATNKELSDLVQRGIFREDLYYRLRVVPVTLPPLRERRQDIPLLVDHFLQSFAAKTGKPINGATPAAMRTLYDYEYPGNIRELENAIERAFVLCHDNTIDLHHLPPEMLERLSQNDGSVEAQPSKNITPAARELIVALEAHRWNRTATAKSLGIGRNTLWRRMKEQGLLDR